MTNAELIQKIRNEIERISSRSMNEEGQDICEYLLSFLSTLNSEKPMQEGLEGEIEMEWDSFNKHLVEYDDDDSDEVIWLNKFSFTDIARHFAQWGAEHAREQMLKEAVEGTVMDFSSNQPRPQVDVYVDPNKYCTGDKVRVIIVKEDGK